MRRRYCVPSGSLAVFSFLLLGCPASQTWTTARTVPAGTVQHTAGVEFVGVTWECPDSAGDACSDPIGFVAVPFPAYVARIGAADMFDLGFKASASGSFGADFKIQLVRTDVFDLALDPGFTVPFIFSFTYVNLPVLFSLNFGEMTTLTLYPKASYWAVFNNDIDTAIDGFFVGGGMNFQIRVGERFAITPGFEWMRSVEEYDEEGTVTFLNFGVGFSFGSMPQYGEQAVMQPEPTAAPPPPGATVIVQ